MANGAYERLYFEEVDGKRRRVVLQGTEAPKGHVRSSAAFALGGEVRRKLKDQPGSDEPVVHVLGNRQRDLVVHVHFRDSMSGENGRALKRVELVEDIRKSARPLRIVWGKVLRIGMLRETEHGVEGEGEFESTLTFDVFTEGERKGRNRSRQRPLALDGSLEGITQSIEGARTALRVPGFSTNFGSTMEELLNLLAAPVAGLLALANDVAGELDDAAYALDSTARRMQQIANQASRLRTRLRDSWAYLSASTNPGEDMVSRMAWRSAQAEALEALRSAVSACTEVGEAAERRAAGTGRSRMYIARSGDTVEQLARRFGTSVDAILKLNPTLVMGPLTPGMKVLVPAPA